MVTINKILSKQELSTEDLTYLEKLLRANLALSDSLKLIRNKKNEKIIDDILNGLGMGFLIENVIKPYLPKKIKGYLLALISKLSFLDSLDLALRFNEKQEDNQKALLSKLAYPVVLLFISITVLYLFDLYGMDLIFNLLGKFNSNLNIFQNLRFLFQIIIKFIYLLAILICLLFLFFMQKNNIVYLYLFLSKYLPNSLICTYYSEEFISLLLLCANKGYKTKQSLEILCKMTSKPIISFLAFHIDEQLLEGNSLKEATRQKYYDNSLSRFVKIASYTDDFNAILNNYTKFARDRFNNKIKQYTNTIQITTYIFIGLIIIFIYQVLFIPMNSLANF